MENKKYTVAEVTEKILAIFNDNCADEAKTKRVLSAYLQQPGIMKAISKVGGKYKSTFPDKMRFRMELFDEVVEDLRQRSLI
ncbi:MAG: hypothetical protein LBH24_04530 [Clostridiales bacterium]|jgi:hypothetical protein|nr:hypothetical protein [Clostridiales bacterium]